MPGTLSSRALRIGPGSGRLVYRAALGIGPADFFSVPIDGSTVPKRLTQLAASTFVSEYALSPDGRWVVFLADLVGPGRFELHRVPADGSEPPLTLHPPLVAGGDVQAAFALTRAGRVVYRADQIADGAVELFSSVIRSPARRATR
jgi:hypothetical protein